ncbi:MAG TPA: aldehyde dehydrogenase family protein [Candidatus Binataceae bacterium]|nr:aldehyde dehydrogenase family protein [Candidatus Binataceae bacterium]
MATTISGSQPSTHGAKQQNGVPHAPRVNLSPLYNHFIGGEWVPSRSGETFETVNPATLEVLSRVQNGTADDVNLAVAAAQEAFKFWGQSSPQERSAVLLKIADRLEAKLDHFAAIEAINNARPIREYVAFDLPMAIEQFRFFAAAIRLLEGNSTTVPGGMRYTLHEPMGVVGQIIPWNVPLIMTAMKIAPALAAGNTVVIKPAEQTPLSILELVKEIQDVIPPGVLNVITGFGPSAGAPLAQHPGIRKVAFTGETTTGRLILQYASENIIPATLELGGKSPGVIFPDCDLERAVEGTIAGICAFNGQQCIAASRLFLHEEIREPFIEKLVGKMKKIVIGDPLDPNTQLGALVSKEQYDRVMGYIELGKQEGARVLCGGHRAEIPGFDGYFVAPTVFDRVNNRMRIAQEEIFGPVLSVITWKDYDQMIEQANDIAYGLAGAIWTNDLKMAHQTAQALQTGTVWINRFANFNAGSPFGGYKKSGIGRELAFETLGHYTQSKSITIDYGSGALGLY